MYDIKTIVIQRHALSTIEQEMGNELDKLALVLPDAAGCQFRNKSVRHRTTRRYNVLLHHVSEIESDG